MLFITVLFLFIRNLFATDCPDVLYNNGYINDIGLLCDAVSSDAYTVQGVCGEYEPILTTAGMYDTRMRIYDNHQDDLFIIFRPTQSTPEGGNIHVDRHLSLCTFINNCTGLVHDRFQEAFVSLLVDFSSINLTNKKVYVAGHSLGGALSLFMTIYLWKEKSILPEVSLGIAGPFIGDQEFSDAYQNDLKNQIPLWWQIESMNNYDMSQYDGTVEYYNVDYEPYLFIDMNVVCYLLVNPVQDSYGMHDLKNYRQGLHGNNCEQKIND